MVGELKRIIYLVKNKDDVQFRYRVLNVIESTKNSKSLIVDYCLLGDLKIKEKELSKADFVVIERQTAKNNDVIKIISELKNNGVVVLFDLDDLVFDYRDLMILMRGTNSKNIIYWIGYFWGIRRIAKKVDGFICTNKYLGEKLKRSFGKPFAVIPNSLNKKQIEFSNKIIKAKKNNNSNNGFSIGYFSGSPTHSKDFRMVEKDLVRFLKEHGQTKLTVVGYMDFSADIQKMINIGRVKVTGLVDYLKLQKLIADVDVNIAPLVLSDFSNCKSELKFFEAAAVETTTIASPTYTFKNAIEDGENGFLANKGEWYGKIEYLYEHPDENRRIARNAREYCIENYYGKRFLEIIEEAYDYLSKRFRL